MGVEKLDDGVDLINPVLHRGASEYKGGGALETLDGDGGLGLPVFYPLRLVENDHVR